MPAPVGAAGRSWRPKPSWPSVEARARPPWPRKVRAVASQTPLPVCICHFHARACDKRGASEAAGQSSLTQGRDESLGVRLERTGVARGRPFGGEGVGPERWRYRRVGLACDRLLEARVERLLREDRGHLFGA